MSIWFPKKELVDLSPLLDLQEISAIEQFDDLFTWDEKRVRYDTGAYRGRLLSLFLGDCGFAVEFAGNHFEIQAGVPPGMYAFGLSMEHEAPIMAYGADVGLQDVMVTPPGSFVHSIIPAAVTAGVIFVTPEALAASLGEHPEAIDWLMGLDRRGEVIRSQWLADRLRDDLRMLIDCAVKARAPGDAVILNQALLTCLSSALSLEFLAHRYEMPLVRAPSFGLFWQARAAMLGQAAAGPPDMQALAMEIGASKRTIEYAFRKNSGLSPVKYFRIHQLAQARRQLLSRQRLGATIGDIAAEQGFADWSRFTEYYQRQFGELPSETRERKDWPFWD